MKNDRVNKKYITIALTPNVSLWYGNLTSKTSTGCSFGYLRL